MRKVIIAKLEAYMGADTVLSLNGDDAMYIIVDVRTGVVLDYGYRTFQEALGAWPEAENKTNQTL